MTPRRHFFDWSSPLAPQAARWLLAQAPSGPCPDLSDWAVMVPTSEAGRRLRAALLREVPGGLLPPATFTPVQFLDACAFNVPVPVAGTEERLAAWCSVLLEADLGDFPALFPEPPPRQDFAWAKGTARLLLQAQVLLIENGWTLQAVAQTAALDTEEDRWENLGRLEQSCTRTLRHAGRNDPARLWADALRNPSLPAPCRRVAVLGTPDPVPALVRLLEGLPDDNACAIGIHAPEHEAGAFDAWGRPVPDSWAQRAFLGAAEEPLIHLSLDEEAQSRRAAALAASHPDARAAVIGLGRGELTPLLEADLREAGLSPFTPSGTPALRSPLWALLDSLQRLLAGGSFSDLLAWARHPGSQRWLRKRRPEMEPSALFAALDRFAQRHLPQAWQDVRDIPARRTEDRAVLEALAQAVEGLLSPLSGPGWIEALRSFLAEAAETGDPSGFRCAETVRAWLEAQNHFRLGPQPGPAERLALFLEEWASQRIPAERPARPERTAELNGWLELGWDERPHLILTGFQEGGIPSSVQGDLLVPESLRARLGLRTNAGRLACDAYQLKALIEQRRAGGRVDLLLSKFSAEGDPLLPSRLLFLCPDEALAARVRRVFQSPGPGESAAAPSPAFRLRPVHRAPAAKTISVTHFRDYLESPYYYYLHRLGRWEPFEGRKREMDPLDFGTLAHAVLEALGRDPALRASTDPARLRAFLREQLDALAHRAFGPRRPLAAEVQLHALHQRFSAFAEHQAAQAAEGWAMEWIEHPFELPLNGWTIKGKIDRIDRHADGRIRLLDYKTSDQAETPEAAHLKKVRGEPDPGTFPPESLTFFGGKPALWRSLQLPLYAHFWRSQNPNIGSNLQCGYIQLPQAVQETAFALWEGFDSALESSAVECAARVLEAIDGGRFWPPLDIRLWNREPWDFWLPGGPAAVVEEPFA